MNSHFIDLEILLIYDRWGNLVYKSTNPDIKWEGHNFAGEDCPLGTYFYFAKYTCLITGDKKVVKGDVTLIR